MEYKRPKIKKSGKNNPMCIDIYYYVIGTGNTFLHRQVNCHTLYYYDKYSFKK